MTRYWINLETLSVRHNAMPYGHARTDAENWLGSPVGWFASPEALNDFISSELLPVLLDAWRSNPDQRLGQLLANAIGANRELFYVPDGDLRDGLKNLCE